jgi:hypothetical protein
VIHPGHKYKIWTVDNPVIAIEPHGVMGCWRVREIEGEWLGASHIVFPEDLGPLPMKYFGGEVPA